MLEWLMNNVLHDRIWTTNSRLKYSIAAISMVSKALTLPACQSETGTDLGIDEKAVVQRLGCSLSFRNQLQASAEYRLYEADCKYDHQAYITIVLIIVDVLIYFFGRQILHGSGSDGFGTSDTQACKNKAGTDLGIIEKGAVQRPECPG